MLLELPLNPRSVVIFETQTQKCQNPTLHLDLRETWKMGLFWSCIPHPFQLQWIHHLAIYPMSMSMFQYSLVS